MATALLLLLGTSCAFGMQRSRIALVPMLQAATPAPAVPLGNVAPDFSLSLAPLPAELERGRNVTLLAIVAGLGDFSGPVTLSTEGELPQWLTVTFTPNTVTPIAPKPGWTATIGSKVYIDTSTIPNFYAQRQSPVDLFRRHGAIAALSATLLLPLAGLRRTRRKLAPLLAIVALACLPFAAGCGEGRYPPQVAPGTYQINITGTASTGQQHTLPVILRVIGG